MALVRWQRLVTSSLNLEINGQKRSNILLRELIYITKDEAAIYKKNVIREKAAPKDLYNRNRKT